MNFNCLSKNFYETLLNKSNNYYYIVGLLSKTLSITKYIKDRNLQWMHNSPHQAKRAHQTLLLSAQKHTHTITPKSYKTVEINKIVCIVADFGEYQQVTKGQRTIPICWDNNLARKIIFSKHIKK